jgi:hypothetical protein
VNEFSQGDRHINGIGSFWAHAKQQLRRFKRLPKTTFHLHLKETGFRFNHRREDIYKRLLKHTENTQFELICLQRRYNTRHMPSSLNAQIYIYRENMQRPQFVYIPLGCAIYAHSDTIDSKFLSFHTYFRSAWLTR